MKNFYLFKNSPSPHILYLKRSISMAFAFTLAEVLITLGIIGIVAAMTIPSLAHNIQDYQFTQAWKKEYSAITQVINQIYADEGETYTINTYDDEDTKNMNSQKYFCKIVNRMKLIKSGLICTDEDNPIHSACSEDHCYWHPVNTYKTKNGLPATQNGYFSWNTAITADGSLIRFERKDFWVDVNGFKPPNVIGKDIFYFLISTDGKNKPYFWGWVNEFCNSSPSYTQITQNNYLDDCQNGTGWGCSAKIILGN